MNGRIVKPDAPAHQAARELLPWLATGQLPPRDALLLEQHLSTCKLCRRELEIERQLLAAACAEADAELPPAQFDVERALAQLLPQLPQQEARAVPAPRWSWRAFHHVAWMPWALALQFLAILGLALLLASPAFDDGAYRGLGGAAGAGNLVVVFKPDTTEKELRRILQANDAHLVDGPTVTDAYLLNVPEPRRARTRLRAEPAVVLAEALDGGDSP
ncbi:zf-HC2 domain-containing protein [Janthinobacterium sp. 75]|uniref:zf-HC2 domain-containing protein n=1 Tax=Janthinobacterium sp. 75 TaxID=2135628 RepID=UPI0010640630|nr:zf-HC2 domain-containing protein [Janthinobacterium sp. 75]TDY35583.1 putative zinc finger protein [Janthinobacterium sp. 75]